uniref:Uncharacterized protein n=1 Tax=Heterorhabditis bacteriophora TaxID=37862 RepID=A0A1I7WFH5_HETBA
MILISSLFHNYTAFRIYEL